MTFTEVALTVILLAVVTMMLTVLALVLLAVRTVRRGRRRYDVLRSRARGPVRFTDPAGWRPAGRAPSAWGPAAWNASSVGAVASTTVASPTWWLAQGRRHRMWRAVTAAEQAVKAAQRAGAPVGDLPSLTRRLRAAAVGVDAQVRASAVPGSAGKDAAAAASRIETAATDLRGAAADAVRVTTADDTEPLMSAIRLEVAALAAGVRAASAASGLPAR